jgi:hypothetical protein
MEDERLTVEPHEGEVTQADHFPLPRGSFVAFHAHIPHRLQEQLIRESGGTPHISTRTEDFRVQLRDGWQMPCAAVELLNAPDNANPSRGVQVVREFLKSELRRTGESRLGFGLVGPTPAHADIYLRPQPRPDGETREFWLLDYSRVGYHRYEYGFDVGDNNGSSPADRFFWATLSEIDLLYRIVTNEQRRGRRWEKVQEALNDLVELQRASGIGGFIRKNTRSASLLNDALLELTEFDSAEVMWRPQLQRQSAQLYAPGAEAYVKELVLEEIEDTFGYPAAQARELIQTLESRRLTDRDLIMLVVSSALGGAIGAAATLIAA